MHTYLFLPVGRMIFDVLQQSEYCLWLYIGGWVWKNMNTNSGTCTHVYHLEYFVWKLLKKGRTEYQMRVYLSYAWYDTRNKMSCG